MVFMPILREHDHAQVQVYCYSGATTSDAITEEARSLADVWHEVAYLSDDALEALIRADEIDVLVDLSGHSAGNRLPVFARKPAPVQVTAWGYATGTGLDVMDAFLIDRVVVPPHERADYAEAIVELPSPICFEPPAELPPVSPLPAISRGYVTFGTFNRLPKVSPGVRDAWAACCQRAGLTAGGEVRGPGRRERPPAARGRPGGARDRPRARHGARAYQPTGALGGPR